MKDLLTVSEAAKELNIGVRRVHVLISEKRLPAEKFGSYYLIKRVDLDLVKDRPIGRPKKEKE